MLKLRKANERGHANHGWLDSHHTFSFGRYYDPGHMGFRALRVINDDVIAGGGGFPFHAHHDMEIISYVTEGALEHKDNMGNGSVIRPGDVQIMSAGTGIEHSEFNHLKDASTHLFQIWIHPSQKGLPPGYAEKHYEDQQLTNTLQPIVSPDERGGSLRIDQDVTILAGRFEANGGADYVLKPERHAWFQVLSGDVALNGEHCTTGDGVAISEETTLTLNASSPAEVLLFDLN